MVLGSDLWPYVLHVVLSPPPLSPVPSFSSNKKRPKKRKCLQILITIAFFCFHGQCPSSALPSNHTGERSVLRPRKRKKCPRNFRTPLCETFLPEMLSDGLLRFLIFKALTCIPLCFLRIFCVCKRSHLCVRSHVSVHYETSLVAEHE